MTEATQSPREIAAAAIAAIGLTVEAVFIPFSQSRNKDEKNRSLNWRVTLKKDGREILTTDYSAGIGHCYSYPKGGKITVEIDRLIERECETGFGGKPGRPGRNAKADPVDVIWSLVCDSSVIDAGGFESWAADYGYDTDSRKAESVYRECLELALKMRAGIGGDNLDTLREAFQDY